MMANETNNSTIEAFIGEVRMFTGPFAPVGWAYCSGQQMSIAQNTALFSLIGTAYGGDGRTYFNLPNFQGIFPIGSNSTTYRLGSKGGSESQRITTANLPPHNHPLMATTTPGNIADPTAALLGNTGSFDNEYVRTNSNMVEMAPNAIGPTGQGEALYTMPPFTSITFIICLDGIYPSRS